MTYIPPKVLAIIPARGGSKGLPRKNILDLCGKPLIAYTIEVASKTTLIDRVIVSTDDAEIANVAKQFGAEVPFLRPKELAGDRSSVGEATKYTVDMLQKTGYVPDVLVTLYPTHPFRSTSLVNFLIQKLLHGYSPVYTVKKIEYDDLSIFCMDNEGTLLPLLGGGEEQNDMPQSYFRRDGLFQGDAYHDNKPYLHIIEDNISQVDIDSMADFLLAQKIIEQNLFQFD